MSLQLVGHAHCIANAEATGSNLVEAPKNVFFGLLRNCLNGITTAMVTSSLAEIAAKMLVFQGSSRGVLKLIVF